MESPPASERPWTAFGDFTGETTSAGTRTAGATLVSDIHG
jgi:hypothetical protein